MMRNRDAYRAPTPVAPVAAVTKPSSPGWILAAAAGVVLAGLAGVNVIRGGSVLPCDALAGMVLRSEVALIMSDPTLSRESRGASMLGAAIGARIGAAQHDALSCQVAMLSPRR